MRKLTPVPPEDIDQVWYLVNDWIEAACLRGTGELSADGLREECKSRQAMLAVVHDPIDGEVYAGVITQMAQQPDGNLVCLILACGGVGMRNCLPLLAEIERGAREKGASSIRFLGRSGWMRMMPDYQIAALVYEKSLRH